MSLHPFPKLSNINKFLLTFIPFCNIIKCKYPISGKYRINRFGKDKTMSDKNKKSKLKETIKKKPLLSSVIVTLPIGLAGASLVYVPTVFRYGGLNAEGLLAMPLSILFVGLMLAAFVLYPLVLTGAELYLLFDLAVNPAKEHPRSRIFDLVTVPLGLL